MVKLRSSKKHIQRQANRDYTIPEDMDRNSKILKNVELARVPVVPFELQLAKIALKGFEEKQIELGQRMGEAMRQSSETWHDNAPAEAIRNDADILSRRAESIRSIIENAVLFEYETNPEAGATLGSLVRVHYHDFGDDLSFLLTGSKQDLTPEYTEKLAEYYPGEAIEMFTVSSPIGKSVLGRVAGETYDLDLGNNKKTKITVESVQHLNL